MNPPGVVINFPRVWRKLLELLKKYPAFAVPFAIIAFFDLLLLVVTFLAPNPPFSAVLAPIVRRFWGEQFLHYPANFILLPELFNYARIAASFVTGITLAALASSMIAQAAQGTPPGWIFGFGKVFRHYLRLAIVWAVALVGVFVAVRSLSGAQGLLGSRYIVFLADYLAGVIIQLVLIFAIPAIMVENKKVVPAIIRSLAMVKRYPGTSFLLVFLPSLLFVPFTVATLKIPGLMERTLPEIVLVLMGLRVIAMAFVDFAINSSATVLLILHRDNVEKGGAAL